MLTCIHGTRDARECPQCVADYLNGKATEAPSAPPAPKLCKDCRHYAKDTLLINDRCTNPKVSDIDLIRGGQVVTYCHVERGLGIRCGRSGALFEPKLQASERTA